MKRDSLIFVARDPKKGFHNDYILFIPKGTPLQKQTVLLVEPNNTGKLSDSMEIHKQYAIDLAPFGVRSNAINADRVRTGLFSPELIESRARARGISSDAYFSANLLSRETLAEDVAQAFAYLATAKATTGAVVPVDGGNPAAFPR